MGAPSRQLPTAMTLDGHESDAHVSAPASTPRATLFLQPGQLAAFARPAAITTILGSCVAVCLWDSRRRRGGANHFLLPFRAGENESSARFGNVAIEQLLAELAALGSRPVDLEAKLFGGARVLASTPLRERHLGLQNVDAARQLLERARIPVVAEDVGGDRGRKLVYHTDVGIGFVRRL